MQLLPIQPTSPAVIRFWGSPTAELFTQEISASFYGVLEKNMVSDLADPMLGFVSASIDGRPWTDTMWTRDAGVFLRELVQWGDLAHACLVAERLISLVRENSQGFCTFPIYFKRGEPGSGSELDGTCTIIIGLVLLWERLPEPHPTRSRIAAFLTRPSSPLAYLLRVLEKYPLVPGSGEFGGGCGIEGDFYNVVQNGLVGYALHAAARFQHAVGEKDLAEQYVSSAEQISANMLRFLRAEDGSWLWAIDLTTLQPDPRVINDIFNKGFGGLNGVLSMCADVLGFTPLTSRWSGLAPSQRTFQALLETPKRKAMFQKYGIWTQFDDLWGGYNTSPSYGHCYATQAMLLMDELEMAGKAVDFLASMTYQPLDGNKIDRDSPYYFYERFYLPELLQIWPELIRQDANMPGWIASGFNGENFDQGCGALNLVNVAEPLKIARLILGLDDSDPAHLRWIPRLPAGWQGMEAPDWPVLTSHGLVRAALRAERQGDQLQIKVASAQGQPKFDLSVRLPHQDGYVWVETAS
jgi:hypothetical protein